MILRDVGETMRRHGHVASCWTMSCPYLAPRPVRLSALFSFCPTWLQHGMAPTMAQTHTHKTARWQHRTTDYYHSSPPGGIPAEGDSCSLPWEPEMQDKTINIC